MYIPNLLNSGHDTGLAYASAWFQRSFAKYLNDPDKMKETLFIITFDEGGLNPNNQIFTLLLGPMVRSGLVVNSCQDHFSLLKTIEDIWDLGNLGRKDSLRSGFKIWKD